MFGLKRPAAVSAAMAKDVPNNWVAVERALDGIGEGRFDSVSLQDVPEALQPALSRLLEKMRANSGRQLQRAVTLSVHANEAMAANAKTSGEMSRAVELAQGIAGAVEHLDQSIESIAMTARSISDAVQTSGTVLSEGADAVREAVSASERVHVSFEAIGAAASGLTESVKQIGTFVATIEGIAQQTNLLALNATIEAARAGAAGRGFSVVAAEVKALSAQTQRATEDIRSRIDHLTAHVTEVLASVDLVRSDVSITARCARSADERIAAARADGEGNVAAVSGITAAIGEQGAAVERISKNVGALNHRFDEARKQYARIVAEIAHCETAIKAQFDALEKRDIPASTLHRAKSDHAMWKRILTEVVFSGRKVTSRDMADHSQCRLGHWMADHGHANPESAALDAPHRAVHMHGKEAAACMLRGDVPGAIAALERTDSASQSMMAALDRAIAAVEADDGVNGASQRNAA